MFVFLYVILFVKLACFLFVGLDAECIEFIAEKCQREGSFANISPVKPEACVHQCEQINSCFAVNFFRLNYTCRLLNRTMPESKLIKETKCWYKALRSPPKESIVNDPCYQRQCPWDEICMHNTTTNIAECYPFCKTPPGKAGAINETVEMEVGQNYTYRCPENVFGKSDQSPTVTCQRDGHWTATKFACVCKTPPEIPWTINQTAEVEVGQSYTYVCQDGLFGKQYQNPKVTCLPDGKWTTTNFACVCAAPPLISGTITEIVELTVGQIYTYSCQSGLLLKGDPNPTVKCLYDGSWNLTSFICAKHNWYLDTIYPNNIRKSDVISQMTGLDLLACMQLCDDHPSNCMSFFYNNIQCVLSSSFRRGLPQNLNFSDGLVYYTAPLTSCDSGYGSVLFGGTMRCIKVYEIIKSFDEAMTICESETAKLFVLSTIQEIADLKALIWSGWTYAGISVESQGGDWVDWKGQPFSPFWSPGEPNGLTSPDCGYATFDKSGLIDAVCNNGGQFVCSKN